MTATAAAPAQSGATLYRLLATLVGAFGIAILVLSSGCAVNPATGERQLALISESQEIQIGKQHAEQVKQSIGLYEDPALQQYVSDVGLRLAAKSERPDLPWSFSVVDDPTVNAFALPGGQIFVTRGILAHFNSEAELAAVLGHEIGHVTGRHSVEQVSKAQLAQLGLGIGSVLSSNVRGMQDVIGQSLGLLFLKHGRDAEREADALGLKYMQRTQYDPKAALDVFTMLDRQSAAAGGNRLPSWLSTHPAPADRRAELAAIIEQMPAESVQGRVDRDEYLRRIDNLVWGVDPKSGYFEENRFVHPTLKFQFTLPQGWQAQNLPQAVIAGAPNSAAGIQLTLAGNGTAQAAAQAFLQSNGVTPGQTSNTTVNGLPASVATFSAQSQQGPVSGIAAHIALDNTVYRLIGVGSQQGVQQHQAAIESTIKSFRRYQPTAADARKAERVDIVTLPSATSINQLRAKRESSADAATLAILNGVGVDTRLPAGSKIKWVQ